MLLQILSARERRAARQRRLLNKYGTSLICFTMNIIGSKKTGPLIKAGFELGDHVLRAQLKAERLPILYSEQHTTKAGYEALYVVDAVPSHLKCITADIEDSMPVGRLFDMDVLDAEGVHWDRGKVGFDRRRCLLCNDLATVCARERRHPPEEVLKKTERLLEDAVIKYDAEHIAQVAVQSLLHELCTTPKPGLCDRRNNGSHTDMDLFTFTASASSLWPYFKVCARIGMYTRDEAPTFTFEKLRFAGKTAEQEMLEATGGVNTHKGAIFTLGLLCGAMGRLRRAQRVDPARVCAEAAAMTRGLVEHDLHGLEDPATAGEQQFAKHGITGIRGEAESGFPSILNAALPILTEGLQNGMTYNDAGRSALLHLIAAIDDTTLIHRSDGATAKRVRRHMRDILTTNRFPDRRTAEQLDDTFIRHGLSVGGAADLLAATYFLHTFRTEGVKPAPPAEPEKE